jgi:hypothetical protein
MNPNVEVRSPCGCTLSIQRNASTLFPMPVIMMNDDLVAREIITDAEKKCAGAIGEDHRIRFIRHPFSQSPEELVGDFLSDEHFQTASPGF